MIGLDCNILIQLAFDDHPAHKKTLLAVRAETQQSAKLICSASVITEFLHVVTDTRRFSPALTMPEVLEWTERLLLNPKIQVVTSSSVSLRQTLDWMRQFNLGRKRILDTHLAAILHTSGVRRLLTSNVADFAVFGVLELIAP
jgi:predicted nucleic acid-binding protein